MISAGDIPLSGSRVLCNCKMACVNASVSVFPVEDMLSVRSYFIDQTATSAQPLYHGLYTDERQCLPPHSCKKYVVSLFVNSGPLLLLNSSGTPNIAKYLLRACVSLGAPELLLSGFPFSTSNQLLKQSTAMR